MQIRAPQGENTLKWEITELNKNLRLLSRSNKKRNVIMRGLLNGVFTAIGASLGFAFFLIGLSNFLQKAENYPILDRIIERTHLNMIIQRYLENLENTNNVPILIPTQTPIPSSTPVIKNQSTPKPTPTQEPTLIIDTPPTTILP